MITAAILLALAAPAAEHPQVTFRHCVREQVLAIGKVAKLTHERALGFANRCDAFARRAAALAARNRFGGKYDQRRLAAAAAYYRKTKDEIVQAHVCAYAFDPKFCQPVY